VRERRAPGQARWPSTLAERRATSPARLSGARFPPAPAATVRIETHKRNLPREARAENERAMNAEPQTTADRDNN
jgi:hypothetical protein